MPNLQNQKCMARFLNYINSFILYEVYWLTAVFILIDRFFMFIIMEITHKYIFIKT